MAHPLTGFLAASTSGAGGVLTPLTVIALCVVAGIGTVLALPGRREAAVRKIGGAILTLALLILAALVIRSAAQWSFGDLYFWIFSGITVFAGIRVVTHSRPVYSALYFVLGVFATAGLFVLLWAEFMAAALILIYAGAILITYVFVIMLASQAHTGTAGAENEGADYDRLSREPIWACAVGFTLMGVLLFVIFEKGTDLKRVPATPAPAALNIPDATSVQALGHYLFSQQVLTLELAGVILTLAMVGAVLVARRHVAGAKVAAEPVEQTPGGAIDDPHAIPVEGTRNPKLKEYPET